MIKKSTTAHFIDGAYKGDYDWSGGIPLSIGEEVTILVGETATLKYLVHNKSTTVKDDGSDQAVSTEYYFTEKV